MTCYSPITAEMTEHGLDWRRQSRGTPIELPCGQCIGCQLETARQMAGRCANEASMHKKNCFVTLTYNDENLPKGGTLVKEHLQLFNKRLRKKIGTKILHYGCGEYGEQEGRPHYHELLFGYRPDDLVRYSENERGEIIYSSESLDKIWGLGTTKIGDLTFESASYCARYTTKKAYGKDAQWHYIRFDENGEPYWLLPEFNMMSTKPAIGRSWLIKYTDDVYKHGHWIVNGRKSRPPRYYDKLLNILDPDKMEQYKEQRKQEARANAHDNTQARLNVKHEVKQAAVKHLRKTL